MATITSIIRQNPTGSPTNIDSVVFRVTFSEDVQNVNTDDFELSGTAASDGSITSVTPISASEYDITIDGVGNSNGSINLDISPTQNITAISDSSPLDTAIAPLTEETFTLDNTAPLLTSVTRAIPAAALTNADTLTFRATFDDSVTNVTGDDFVITGPTGVTITATQVSGDPTAYNIQVSGGDLANFNGNVDIALDGGADISDAAGNLVNATGATFESYELDNTAPVLQSFERLTPLNDTTNADSITFLATFSEAVENVGVNDFVINTVPASGTASITSVTPSATNPTTQYEITIGSGIGFYNGEISIDLAASPTIRDLASNALPTGEPATDEAYTLDNTAATIQSVTAVGGAAADGSYRAGDVIEIAVQFSEDVLVTGTPELQLETGITDAVATYDRQGATPDILIFSYTVADGENAGDLNYRNQNALVLPAGATISDAAGNDANRTLPALTGADSLATNQDIVIDTVLPTVTSIARLTPANALTAEDTLIFRVTFSEAVDAGTVDAGDFAVTGSTATVTGIAPVSATEYDLTVSGGDLADLDGVVGLDLATPTITDVAGNNVVDAEPTVDQTYQLDNTAPTITSINSTTSDGEYNAGETLSIQVTFSEAVVVTGTPTLTLNSGGTAAYVSGSNSTTLIFNYTVGAGDTDTNDLDVTGINLPGGAAIADGATNDAATTLPIGTNLADNKELVIDNTVPTLLTVVRQTPTLDPIDNPDGRTNADNLTFRVTFSEEMVGVGIDDFAATGTTATVSAVTPVGAAGTVFDVTLSGGDLAGLAGDTTIGLTFAGAPSLTDVAGNAVDVTLPAGADYETFIVENTAPTITGVTSTTADGTYGVGTDIAIEVAFDEVVFVDTTNGTPTLNLNSSGSAVAEYVSGDGTDTLLFRYTVADGEDSLDLDYDGTTSLQLNGGTIRDLAANDATIILATPGTANSISDDQDIVVDTTEPTVVSIVRQDPTTEVTNSDALTFRVTFSEEVDQATVEAGDFTVNGVVVPVTNVTAAGSDAVFDVVVDGGAIANFNGVVGLDVTGEIQDAGGNILNITEPTTDETFTLDNTAPAITNITSSTPDGRYNAGNTISIQVEFDGPINVDPGNQPSLDLSNGATATFVSASGNTLTFSYTIADGDAESADLDVTTVNTTAGSITDAAGNDANVTIPAGENLANEKDLIVDTVVPTLVSITRLDPAIDIVANPTALTNSDSVVFQVTFSEAVRAAGVTAADFLPDGTTATITSVEQDGGTSETVFNITLLGGDLATLDGLVGLDLSPTAIIQDLAGNNLNPADVATPDETFTLDNTAPTVQDVAFDNTATPDGTYSTGDVITILVTFNEGVTVTGAPELTLDSGGTATYDSSSPDGTVLTFLYTVVDGDTSADLDYTNTNALVLSGGAIADLATNAATLTLPAPGEVNSLSDDRDVIVDTTQPTTISIERETPDVAVTNEDTLVFRVTFSEDVTGTVDAADFEVDGTSTATVTNVTAVSGTEYDVEVSGGDLANFNGTVGLNLSGTADIDDAGGNNVVIAEPTIDELYTLDNVAPVISTITSTTPDDSYNSGDVISIQITFDGAVTVDTTGGTPTLTLDSGGAATYDSISADRTVLTFLYTVADGDTSDDLDVTAINLDGGVIADAATNAVDLTLPTGSNLVDNSDLVIDTAAPTLVSILRQTPALDPVANPDNLTNADELVFQLTFSEAMEGVGIADFAVTGNTTATVTDVSAVGTTGTVFNVTVSGGDLANLPGNEDIGLAFAAGADLTDVADNAVDPTLPAAPDDNQTFTVENTPPQVVDVDFDGTATPDGTYGIGDDVTILVTFSEAVTVTGSPTLTLDSGGTATYNSSSPDGTVLTFLYTVGAGEDSADLDYGSTTALNLSGGTIADIATNAADLALVAPGDASSLSDDRDVVIDTTQPTVLSILRQDPALNPTNADTLTFRVTFSEVVDPATVEAADFTVDGVAAIVASATPVGGDNAVYDVVIDDAAIANFNGEVGLNLAAGATVTDAGGNNVAIAEPPATSDETYTLDNTAPIITSITSATPDGSYNAGAIISIQVTFDGVVQVDTMGGNPTLTLNSGGTATYDSISTDGTVITFLYTVADGEDTDDLNVATLELNGGVIADAATNDAALTLPAGANLDVSSDLIIDTVAPTLNSILRQTPALNPADNPTGRTNADELVFRLTFSEAMDGIGIDDFAVTGTTTATVTNISPVGMGGTVFDVTVSGGDLAGLAGDADIGLEFAPGAVLTDVADNQVEATLPTPPDNQTFVVENTLPTVTDVTSAIADDTYGVGEEIDITITFSEVVFVTGAPTLTLNSGGTADYLQGDGTDTLTFRYTVADGENSADLDYASTSALTLNGGSISDLATNSADLTLAALDPTGLLGDNKAIVIDTENPSVVSILRETPADELTNATSLVFRVTFSEDVTGTVEAADFAVNSASTATVTGVNAVSGTEYDVTVSGGNLASFNGTVGLDLATGADIDDVSGNNVLIQEPTPAENDQTYTLDTTAPTVANVTSPLADGTYRVGDIIPITITFSEVVTVTGTPTLTLETGATDAVASFVEGSGTDTLTFNFTVQAGEATDDLEYVAGNSLALAGGATIVDAAGNAATLTLPNTGNTGSLGFNKEIAIDTIVPELTSIARQDPTDELTTATSVTFRLTFTEAVENINPADFTITGGSTATVSNVNNVGGNVVFDVTVSGGDIGDDTFSGTLGLALATASDIGDAAGNLAVLAGGATVETYTFDNTAPAITNVTAQQADGIYDVGDEILIDVTFDDVVTVAGVPTLALETGEDDAIATYVSGDGTDTLTFTYTVRAGDETVDLDYLGTDALALGAGATIQDAFGNNADLTLPEPGAANSLGANRDIRVDTVAPELQSITRQTPEGQRTNANSLVFLVSFSEDVENLDAADFTITGNSTATVTGIAPSTETPGDYAVTVSGGDLAGFNGQVGLVINDGAQDITDPAGRDLEVPTNPDPAETYLLDNEAPTVTGIVRRTPATQNTVANTVIFTVIFSDQVEDIDVSDFTLDTTGSLTATVDSVSATEGDRVNVTVTDVDGEGTVSLDVLASATLIDNAGNGLTTGFTDGEFYRRDTTTPTVEINPVRPLLQDGVVTPAPNSIRIRFSEAVTGFEVNDLSLTRNGNAINLNGATLTANNANTVFTLGNLSTLTAPDGNYSLTLNAGTAGIVDGVGNALTDGDEIDWVRASTSPVPPQVPIFNPSNPPERIAGTVRADILRGTNGPDFIQARARNDVARGLGGNDRITGQTGDDRLFGGGGSDRLIGGPGNDILSGQGNADFIEGNRGRDILRGGAGNDTLVGGIGNDTLIGGGGADVYRFNVARDARDTIQRFDLNSDVIDLTNLFDRPNYQGASPVQRFFDYVVIGTTADGGTSIRIDEDGSGPSRETYTLVELEGIAPSLVSSRNFVIG
ncbi:hypothetical protein [Vacuolonema iberomarrocanum]|uniref:hypothetical protein n=1 Tax=Vacuolonema iberomarrocanum TaxID=3454632 RepID=UPI0019F9AD11|nr:hypothetical protein [filamentous cyanobacterium LEGE 07170]